MTKTFPKSRICVIDIYPSFEKGLKLATDFAAKHNVKLNSADGRRIILGFCLKSIESAYKTTSSSFPKVLCMSKRNVNKRVKMFVDSYFDGMMKYVPFPYCGTYDMSSPDLEHVAANSLKASKTQQKFKGLVDKLKLKMD